MDGTNQIMSLSEKGRDRFIYLVDLTGENNNKNTSYNSCIQKYNIVGMVGYWGINKLKPIFQYDIF